MTCDNPHGVKRVFEEAPVLVEARFPGTAASPDWYLLDEEDELDALLERLGTNVELYLSSVWDLKNPRGPVCMKKDKPVPPPA